MSVHFILLCMFDEQMTSVNLKYFSFVTRFILFGGNHLALAAELLSQNPECVTDRGRSMIIPDDHVANPEYFPATSQ